MPDSVRTVAELWLDRTPAPAGPACLYLLPPVVRGLAPRHPLGPGPVLVGRAAGAGVGVVLPHPSVGDPHARLELLPEGGCRVTDLGSGRQTWINGEPVASAVRRAGDFLRLGRVEMRFRAARGLG